MTTPSRDLILAEIRRIGAEEGRSPGKGYFAKRTGITEGQWLGRYWARWSEALTEAGLTTNNLNRSLERNEVLGQVADLAATLGRLPTPAELKLAKRRNPTFPNHNAVRAHLGNKAGQASNVAAFLEAQGREAKLVAELRSLSTSTTESTAVRRTPHGWVYLLASGNHFKIGRSETVERRIKEISVALPESVTLIHAIQTDDPAGIEAYWHRRFADRRANGEWFKLDPADIRAFKRRKFQ